MQASPACISRRPRSCVHNLFLAPPTVNRTRFLPWTELPPTIPRAACCPGIGIPHAARESQYQATHEETQ